MKRILFQAVVFALFFLVLGFFNSYHLPQIKIWAKNQITLFSEQKLPVRIYVKEIGLSLSPLGLSFSDILLLPKNELKKSLAPVKIKSLSAGIHFLSVLTGRRNIYDVTIEQPEVSVILKQQANAGEIPKSIPVEKILSLPFHSISIAEAQLRLKSDEAKISTEITNLNANIVSTSSALSLTISTPQFKFKRQEKKSKTGQVALETELLLEKKSLQINTLKIQRGESTVVGTALLEGDVANLNFNRTSIRGRINVDINETINYITSFVPSLKIPQSKGLLDASLQFEKKESEKSWRGEAQLITQGLKILKFNVGEVKAKFKYENSKYNFDELQISNKAGTVNIQTPTLVQENDKVGIEALLRVEHLEIAEFLYQLGAPRPPVNLQIHGELPCKGTLKPKLLMSCDGHIAGDNFIVFDPDDKENIVQLKNFSVRGAVTVDEKGVYPQAELQVGDNKGNAKGQILYSEGFKFEYQTPEFQFSNISLLDLNLQGAAALKGTVKGDGDYAVVDMEVQTKDFWLADYAVGNLQSHLVYKSGDIKFAPINGKYGSSLYEGHVTINIPKKNIQGNIQFPFAEINDLQKALGRKAQLPFLAYGTGSANIKFHGPLEFTELSYQLTSSFNQGLVGQESFDQMKFNISSDKGHVKTEAVSLTKSSGTMTMTGIGEPSGQVQVNVQGKGLPIEDFQVLNSKGLGLSGLFDFNMNLKGHILKPEIELEGHALQTSVNEQSIPDSHLKLKVNSESLNGQASIMKDKIISEFSIPLKNQQPFLFKLKTDKWNFTPLFYMISPSVKQLGYETLISTDINLSSESGGYKKSNGKIDVSEFEVRRGTMGLKAKEPLVAIAKSGVIEIKNFVIDGDNTKIVGSSRPAVHGQSQMVFQGNIDIGLLSFLAPFLQEVRGLLTFSSQVQLSDEAEIQGSAFIEQGYFKLKDFPHAIEQVKSDISFSQKQININSLSGSLAGGKISGEGYVQLKGYKNFPAQLQLRLDNTKIQIPDGVVSQGNGKATISGNWFPYLMEGSYNISQGNITRNFQNEQNLTIRRSSYLPKALQTNIFDPVEFNINAYINGPYTITNNILDTLIAGSLVLRGTPSNPVLLGDIKALKGGTVFMGETPFIISTASLKFDTTQELNPQLFGIATARVKSREYDTATSGATAGTVSSRTREYEVNMLVQGRMKNPKIKLSSQPPLDENDIISLLALGVTSRQLDKRQSVDQAADLGSAILSNNLSLKNNLFDVKISSSDKTQDQNLADSKVTISRQWSPRVSTSVGRTLRSNITDARVQYDLNDNLSAILNWEGRQASEENLNSKETKTASDKLGVGIEYGMEFK